MRWYSRFDSGIIRTEDWSLPQQIRERAKRVLAKSRRKRGIRLSVRDVDDTEGLHAILLAFQARADMQLQSAKVHIQYILGLHYVTRG